MALVQAVAHKIERQPPVFFADPVGPMLGLGVCSVAAARATSMPSRKLSDDGADGVRRT